MSQHQLSVYEPQMPECHMRATTSGAARRILRNPESCQEHEGQYMCSDEKVYFPARFVPLTKRMLWLPADQAYGALQQAPPPVRPKQDILSGMVNGIARLPKALLTNPA